MIRTIERILKKHLEDGEANRLNCEVEDVMTAISPYEYIWPNKTYSERLALARELTVAITGTNMTKLIKIPCRKEAEEFIKTIVPSELIGDTEYIWYHARVLRQWLAKYKKELWEYSKNRNIL